MNNLQTIIDFQRHPINDSNSYVRHCRSELKKNSILVLNNFLTKEALVKLQHEAQALHDKAFYCSQNHNIFLTEKNIQLDDNHPCNIEMISNKGCVPHDLIPHDPYLRTIYNSAVF